MSRITRRKPRFAYPRSPVTELDETKGGPSMRELNAIVNDIVNRSSPWELYLCDCAHLVVGVAMFATGIVAMRSGDALGSAVGILLGGCSYIMFYSRGAHMASHSALGPSPLWNAFCKRLFVEVFGGSSSIAGVELHVKIHHPYTNIIGLGDSDTWKMPRLGRYVYMLLAPVVMPVIAPVVSLNELRGRWWDFISCLALIVAGIAMHCALLMYISGLSFAGAVLNVYLTRGLFSHPYIHVNIFQHIGQPMFSQDNRPKRIYQMAHGILDLPRNPFMNFLFGHSIYDSHITHHLYPSLSDHMCGKLKPVVKKYLQEHGLPVTEDTYFGRFKFFLDNYDELMVKLPPITQFIGIR